MLNLATRPLSTDCPEEARATVSIAHSAHTACLTRFQPAKSRMLSKTSTWHALFQFARLASTESFNAFRTKNSSSTRLAASRLRSATTSRSATRTRASAARRRLTTTKKYREPGDDELQFIDRTWFYRYNVKCIAEKKRLGNNNFFNIPTTPQPTVPGGLR